MVLENEGRKMSRIGYLREKHRGFGVKLGAALAMQRPPPTCGECAKYRRSECNYRHIKPYPVLPDDPAPEDCFEPRKGRAGRASSAKTWKLVLDAKVPEQLKPCGFTGDVLTEACWLPYQNTKGNVALRPSIILTERGNKPQILDFLKQDRIKGVFPSRDLKTLMTPEAARMIANHTSIEPHDIDRRLDEAFHTHLDMPDAERIICKRWIEASYFFDVFDAYPIQSILGVSESGKSRLCMLNLALCYHGEPLIDPTEAGIFRSKEEDKVSLIIDEAEYLNNPRLYATIRILLNASYSKHIGFVTRYDEINGKRVKRRFDLYSPMCVSGIAGLTGVTLSRAFRIVMKRVDKDFPKANPDAYRTLRDMLYVLRIRRCFEVHDLYRKVDISDIVTARFEELFKPLFTMTKFFGTDEEWKTLAEWCREYQENFRVEALNVAEEEQVLVCLARLQAEQKEVMPDWYQIKDVADLINAEYNRRVSSKHVSSILYRLGLTRRKKVKGYTLVYAGVGLLEECARRIGVHLSELPTPQTLPTQISRSNRNWLNKKVEKEMV